MEFSQAGIDSLRTLHTGLWGFNIWFTIEIVVISLVIIYQLYISGKIYRNIKLLRGIFRDRLTVISGHIDKYHLDKKEKSIEDIVFVNTEEDANRADQSGGRTKVRISVTETPGDGIIRRISDSINLYLLNNYGAAVNFSIIKDIIDREVEVKDEEISNSLPAPLYLGLAATMTGIIFGLFSMPESNGSSFAEGIDALVNGVKLAMLGSLTGLVCTTFLSSFFYKNAKKNISRDKNEQISYLQATLLPELVKAEDTGVSGLKASLDRFARVATGISDNVLQAVDRTAENIASQNEVLDKVGSLDVLKISKANLEMFEKLESNLVVFTKFSEYISLMSRISDNLGGFASRTANIDVIIRQIDYSLQESQRLSRFLTSHLEKIEVTGMAALKAVDLSDTFFREAIERLKEETDKCLNQAFRAVNDSSLHFSASIEKLEKEIDERISQMNRNAADNESKLAEIYHEMGTRLSSITTQHLSQIQAAYSNAVPRFEQLNNLETLPKIQSQLSDSISQLRNDSNINTARLVEAVNQLSTSLTGVIERLNNYTIASKQHRQRIRKPVTGFFRKLRHPSQFFARYRSGE